MATSSSTKGLPTPESIVALLQRGLSLHDLRELTGATKALAESSSEHATAATFLRLACGALADHLHGHKPLRVEDANQIRDRFVPAAEAMLNNPGPETYDQFARTIAWALEDHRFRDDSGR